MFFKKKDQEKRYTADMPKSPLSEFVGIILEWEEKQKRQLEEAALREKRQENQAELEKLFPAGSEIELCGVRGVVMGVCYDYYLCEEDKVSIYFPSTDTHAIFTSEQLGVEK